MTPEALETVRPYEDAIIAAIARGELACSALVNERESIASYCVGIDIYASSLKHKIKHIRLFPNDDRAFPLVKWIPKETLRSLAPARTPLDNIPGVRRDTRFKVWVNTILEYKPDVPDGRIEEHIDLHFGSLWVGTFLSAKDRFHLHRSELINAWRANIAQDLYGREDTRKVARAFARILREEFPSWKPDPPSAITDMLLLTRLDLQRGGGSHTTNDGRAFERLCREILVKSGWQVSSTATSGDFGGDLIAERDGLRWCIQCKDTGAPSGVKSVQQAVGALGYYGCDYAAVASRNGFTEQALILAGRLKVALFNEHSLAELGQCPP